QRDPQLQSVVAKAIAEAQCFTDQYDSAVWYTLMEPRLRRIIKEKDERLDILRQVYCETHRPGEARLPPGLVMALIDVESRFNRWAVSPAGAVGLMQVMPFWPERLGMRRHELIHVAPNIRMGCAILRFYLGYERNDVRKALAPYNGSPGRRDYPDLVLSQWTRWSGADDLGFPKTPPAPRKCILGRAGARRSCAPRLPRAGVLRGRVWRQHACHALAARVGRPLIGAVGEARHAVQSGVLGMAALQLDAPLAQPGEQRGRELRDLTAEGVAACDEVRQLDRLFERQLPGEQSHQGLGIVFENRGAGPACWPISCTRSRT